MKLTQQEEQVIRNLAHQFKSEWGAHRVVLYGSASRGMLVEDSDIDLMVVLPTVDWEVEKRLGGLAFDAGLEINRVISTLCFSVEELEHGPMRASPLIHNIQSEGVLL